MAEAEERHVDIKKQYSGTTYQIKVLLLLLCRGKKIENNEHFYLRTEVKDAEKFDDALFYYRKKDETKYNVRYCQIKNSESETAELKYSDFVSDFDKAVANFKKYFISYRKIKMRAINENVNVEDFIFCTSYKMSMELKKDAKANDGEILTFTESNNPDELFGTDFNQWKRYTIDKISSELENSLMKTTNLDLLAEELIEAIIKSKKQNSSTVVLDVRNFWLSTYEFALKSEKVLIEKVNIKSKMSQKGNTYYVFSEEFLKGIRISKECENFRKIFLSRCATKFLNMFLRDKQFAADDSFMNIFESSNKNSAEVEMEPRMIQKLAKQISEYFFNDAPLSNEIICDNNFLNSVFKKFNLNTLKFNGDFVQNNNLPKATAEFKEHFLLSYIIMELENLKLKFMRSKDILPDDYSCFFKTLTNNINHEKEILEFFENFSIQTLPHHDELMNVITEEIGEEFNLLDDKAVTYSLLQKVEEWLKKTIEQPLDKTEIDKFYDEIKKDIVIQMTERNVYVEMLKTYNLSFETLPYTWKNFLNPSNKDASKNQINHILFLSSDEPILTAIKVQDLICSLDFYKKYKSYIMIPASVLLRMEITANYITEALNLNDRYDLIVIVDDNRAETITVFTRYLKSCGKKIILITKQKNLAYNTIKDNINYFIQEEDDIFEFNHLTLVSQEYILKKNVVFQGLSVPLSSIVDGAFHLIDSKTVMELVSNKKKLEIGTIIEPYKEYDAKYYIERKIGLIKMKEEFFTKNFSNSVFLIEGKSFEDIQYSFKKRKIHGNYTATGKWNLRFPFIGDDFKNAKKNFEELCINYAHLRIFWFKLINNDLFWFHCNPIAFDTGSRDSPMQFLEIYYQNEKTAINFLCQLKTVVIADTQGMGKSTILTSLIQRDKNNIVKWKIRIDLNKYSEYLSNLTCFKRAGYEDYKDIGKYVMNKLNDRVSSNVEDKPFEFHVFDEMFCKNKVILIFDGFDEISPDYETIVLNMFEKIKISTDIHLWITTRSNAKDVLERKLKTFSFTIMPFTVDDQRNFLKKLWKSNWKNDWNQKRERHLNIYVTRLVIEFNEMTKRNYTAIIGIPLQTKMLGDVFQENKNEETDENGQSCHKFLKDTSTCDSQKCQCSHFLRNKLQNLYIIYDVFVKKHIIRYLNLKLKISNSNVGFALAGNLYIKKVHKMHQILGLYALAEGRKVQRLITPSEYDEAFGEANFGLISDISYCYIRPLFTHLTLAEFFAAKYLHEKILSHSLEVFDLMNLILQRDVPVFLYCIKYLIKTNISRAKLEKALGNTTVINYSARYGFFNCLKYFTIDDDFEDVFPQIDKFGKTPLHYAVEFKKTKCVVFILLQKYNRFSKSNASTKFSREKREIKENDKLLLDIQKNTRLFLLKEFIMETDEKGKTALDYSEDPVITDMLNDFIRIGRNSVIPKQTVRANFSRIQCLRAKYDFTKAIDGKEKTSLLNDIIYYCSIKTLTTIIHYFETLLLDIQNFTQFLEGDFFNIIADRNDISANEKLIFFDFILEKKSLLHLRQKIVATILIIHDNQEIFPHFLSHYNICNQPNKFIECFEIACKYNKLNFIVTLFKNIEKNQVPDLSQSLSTVYTNMSILKTIFKQIEGNFKIERKYAEKVLPYFIKLSHRPSTEMIKFLLEKGAGIHLEDDDGISPWKHAVKGCYEDVMEMMTPYLMDIKVKRIVKTPLYYATEKNDVEMVKFLLMNGAKLEKKCCFKNIKENECTKFIEILHQLFQYIYEQETDELMKNLNISPISGFSICDTLTARDSTGNDFLKYALLLNDYELVTFILKNGAAINATYKIRDKKILNILKFVNKIFDYVKSGAYETSSIIQLIEENQHTEIITKVRQSNSYDTLLHTAVNANDSEMVEWLIKNGSDLSAENQYNKTALHLAQDLGNKQIIRLFENQNGLHQIMKIPKRTATSIARKISFLS